MTDLLDHRGQPIPASTIARARASAEVDIGGGGSFEGASLRGAWWSNWSSWITSPDKEWLPVRDFATARGRDQIRNDPIANTAVQRKKNTVVGKGWRMSSRPVAKTLGITPEQAAELGEQIETEWKLYAYGHSFQIDGQRKQDFGGLLRLLISHFMTDGEMLGLVEWADDEPTRYKTRLRVVDPDRLSNPYSRLNDAVFRGGVEHAQGIPIRYWLREQHPNDFFAVGSYIWQGWDRYTPWGRPQVLHGYEPSRAGQTRGISRFVSALKSFRALSRFTDATLQNATINALFAAFVQSSAGPDAVSENFSADDMIAFDRARDKFYGDHSVGLGGDARAVVLPFGDEIKMATAGRETASIESFVRTVVRPIAATLGVTYEEITGDLSQVNYVSLRFGWLSAQRDADVIFALAESEVVRPFFVAFLEEAFDQGYVKAPPGAPAFEEAPDAYANALWIGPGQGQVDPVKEVLGDAAAMEAQTATLEDICAKQGKDWRDVLLQIAREDDFRRSLGLETSQDAIAQAVQDARNNAKKAPAAPPEEGAEDPAQDEKPGAKPAPGARVSALGRLRSMASAAHDLFLDDRRSKAA